MHDAEALCVPLQPLEVVHQAPRKVGLHLQQHTVHNEGCQRPAGRSLYFQLYKPYAQPVANTYALSVSTYCGWLWRNRQQASSAVPYLAAVCNVCTLRAIPSELSQLLSLLSTMRHLLHHDMCETPSHGMWWVTLTRTLTPSEIALHKLSR